MARLRFPGRPGYRFDRIGVRYGADEASKTTDSTLAIVASIHRGLRHFRDLFGESDEEEEFHGFSDKEISAAESKLRQAIKEEQRLHERQTEELQVRYERSQARIADYQAAGLIVPTPGSGMKKTFQRLVDSDLVTDARPKFVNTAGYLSEVEGAMANDSGRNKFGHHSLKEIKVKRLTHTIESQGIVKNKKSRPGKEFSMSSEHSLGMSPSAKGDLIVSQNLFSTSRYKSAAQHILAKATKHAAQSSMSSKVRKFVLPSKSSRSSRVIKPNKRFLEEDSVQNLVSCKQSRLHGDSPPALSQSPLIASSSNSTFSLDAGGTSASSFSAFTGQGISLSPLTANRDKGFPSFSAAPQPIGISTFTDGMGSHKPLGLLDQPLIVEGKRSKKPSLIMRMKLVEDNPEDEILLQQQLADVVSPGKPVSSYPNEDDIEGDHHHDIGDETFDPSSASSPSLISKGGFGPSGKSLIAPAKLFTDSTKKPPHTQPSSSFLRHRKMSKSSGFSDVLFSVASSSQNTVVLRQAKLHLNRTALNRSKAALARSLKAQLKREAKLERRKRLAEKHKKASSSSSNETGSGAVAPSTTTALSQMSPFSQASATADIDRQKSGLFEGMADGIGSFSPNGVAATSPDSVGPQASSSAPAPAASEARPPRSTAKTFRLEEDLQKEAAEECRRTFEELDLLRQMKYHAGSKHPCLVCRTACRVKCNRKLPKVPLCKACKKFYFFQINNSDSKNRVRTCPGYGSCVVYCHPTKNSLLYCIPCKFQKFLAACSMENHYKGESILLSKVRSSAFVSKTPTKKKRHKSGDSVQDSEVQSQPSSAKTSTKKKRHKSGDSWQDYESEYLPSKSVQSKVHHGHQAKRESARRAKHRSGDSHSSSSDLCGLSQTGLSPLASKELINARNLDKPLSVDVGSEALLGNLSPPQTHSPAKTSPGKNNRSPTKKGSKSTEERDLDSDSNKFSWNSSSSRGPRIKHVCRRAAMVFPQQRATFPESQQTGGHVLTLSALPSEEKEQLLARAKLDAKKTRLSSEEESSDEEVAKFEAGSINQKSLVSPKAEVTKEKKKSGRKSYQLEKLSSLKKRQKKEEKKRLWSEKRSQLIRQGAQGKRRIRCQKCEGCNTPECGKCANCKDKPKFGGPNKLRKACLNSVCANPRYTHKATHAFINPKSPTGNGDDDDGDKSHNFNPSCSLSFVNGMDSRKGSARLSAKGQRKYQDVEGEQGNGASDSAEEMDDVESDEHQSNDREVQEPQRKCGLDLDGSQLHVRAPHSFTSASNGRLSRSAKVPKAVEATVQLVLTDIRAPSLVGRIGGDAFSGKLGHHMKAKEKRALEADLPLVISETAYLSEMPLKSHLIRSDYREDYDVETAWYHGFSLTITGTSCVRTLCYLCGSAGKDELIFCIVCCQPYHSFCLDEDERPEEGGGEDDGEESPIPDDQAIHHQQHLNSSLTWCCRRCQFCNVCGQQNGLLKCHRCRDLYHPECLGPNYPTKPSKKKNIWVCTKCVRCKSCGATTPGVGTSATWTYDFSLCYECGKLMDKGNFCPVCHKCYSDDDWESKMIHCVLCDSWVHARCEELTDEMYQLLSCLPDDVQFTCRVCSPERMAYWEKILKSEFVKNLLHVYNCLMGSKCTQVLMEAGPLRSKSAKARSSDSCSITSTSPQVCESPALSSVTSQTTAPNPSSGDHTSATCNVVRVECNSPDIGNSLLTSKGGNSTCATGGTNLSVTITDVDQEDPLQRPFTVDLGDAGDTASKGESGSSFSIAPTLRSSGISDCDATFDPYSQTQASSTNCSSSTSCVPSFSSVILTPSPSTKEEGGRTDLNQNGDIIVPQPAPNHNSSSLSTEEGWQKVANVFNDAARRDKCSFPGLSETGSLVNSHQVGCGEKVSDSLTHCASHEQQKFCDSNKVASCVNCLKNSCSVHSHPSMQKIKESVDNEHSHSVKMSLSQGTSVSKHTKCNGFIGRDSRHFPPYKLIPAFSRPSSSSSSSSSSLSNDKSRPESVHQDFQSEFDPVLICAQKDDKKANVSNSKKSSGNMNEISLSSCESHCTSTTSTVHHSLTSYSEKKARDKDSERTELPSFHKEDHVPLTPISSPAGSKPEQVRSSATPLCSSDTVGTRENSSAQQSSGDFPNEKALVMSDALGGANGSDAGGVSFEAGTSLVIQTNDSPNCAHDFQAVRIKIESGSYDCVEEFSEDMVRIIQYTLKENEGTFTRRKQANSMRSIFIKQMERYFPWFNVNTCKLWDHNRGFPEGMLKEAVLPPSSDHTYAQWLERQEVPMSPQPSPFKHIRSPVWPSSADELSPSEMRPSESGALTISQSALDDTRCCVLCGVFSDGHPQEAGRLLYCGQNEWIHIHCALWSAEVFEANDGSLQNVLDTVSRGRKLRCNLCQQVGATVGCCEPNCPANYHFMCARQDHCLFQEDTRMFCKLHAHCIDGQVITDKRFETQRRVCVDIERVKNRSRGKMFHPDSLSVLFGSCTVEELGELKSCLSDTEECLLPIGFKCTRIYWSTRDARRRCVYTCRIIEVKPETVTSEVHIKDIRVVHDEDHPDFLPYDQLNLDAYGIPNFTLLQNFKVTSPINEAGRDLICLGGDASSTVSAMLDANAEQKSLPAGCHQSFMQASSSVVPARVLPSGNFVSKHKSAARRPVDLSGLSPSTLALLNIKDPANYIPPSRQDLRRSHGRQTGVEGNGDELGLIQIANRLNKAASNVPNQEGAPKRSASVDKLYSSSISSNGDQAAQSNLKRGRSQSLTSSPVMFQGSSGGSLGLKSSSSANFPVSTTTIKVTSERVNASFRAQSESPLSVRKPYEIVPSRLLARSASLSPPPTTAILSHFHSRKRSASVDQVTLKDQASMTSIPDKDGRQPSTDREFVPTSVLTTPIVEISESEEDDESMVTESACKSTSPDLLPLSSAMERDPLSASTPISATQLSTKSNCDPSIGRKEASSSSLSPECLQSILENVPEDLLGGDNEVKVIVLEDVEDMSEEDLICMASAALEETKSDEGEEGGSGGDGSEKSGNEDSSNNNNNNNNNAGAGGSSSTTDPSNSEGSTHGSDGSHTQAVSSQQVDSSHGEDEGQVSEEKAGCHSTPQYNQMPKSAEERYKGSRDGENDDKIGEVRIDAEKGKDSGTQEGRVGEDESRVDAASGGNLRTNENSDRGNDDEEDDDDEKRRARKGFLGREEGFVSFEEKCEEEESCDSDDEGLDSLKDVRTMRCKSVLNSQVGSEKEASSTETIDSKTPQSEKTGVILDPPMSHPTPVDGNPPPFKDIDKSSIRHQEHGQCCSTDVPAKTDASDDEAALSIISDIEQPREKSSPLKLSGDSDGDDDDDDDDNDDDGDILTSSIIDIAVEPSVDEANFSGADVAEEHEVIELSLPVGESSIANTSDHPVSIIEEDSAQGEDCGECMPVGESRGDDGDGEEKLTAALDCPTAEREKLPCSQKLIGFSGACEATKPDVAGCNGVIHEGGGGEDETSQMSEAVVSVEKKTETSQANVAISVEVTECSAGEGESQKEVEGGKRSCDATGSVPETTDEEESDYLVLEDLSFDDTHDEDGSEVQKRQELGGVKNDADPIKEKSLVPVLEKSDSVSSEVDVLPGKIEDRGPPPRVKERESPQSLSPLSPRKTEVEQMFDNGLLKNEGHGESSLDGANQLNASHSHVSYMSALPQSAQECLATPATPRLSPDHGKPNFSQEACSTYTKSPEAHACLEKLEDKQKVTNDQGHQNMENVAMITRQIPEANNAKIKEDEESEKKSLKQYPLRRRGSRLSAETMKNGSHSDSEALKGGISRVAEKCSLSDHGGKEKYKQSGLDSQKWTKKSNALKPDTELRDNHSSAATKESFEESAACLDCDNEEGKERKIHTSNTNQEFPEDCENQESETDQTNDVSENVRVTRSKVKDNLTPSSNQPNTLSDLSTNSPDGDDRNKQKERSDLFGLWSHSKTGDDVFQDNDSTGFSTGAIGVSSKVAKANPTEVYNQGGSSHRRDQEPYKCPTCKRIYRTLESYQSHVQLCDFEVSTSDEEDMLETPQAQKDSRKGHSMASPLPSDLNLADDLPRRSLLATSATSSVDVHQPLSIIISDDFKDVKFSPPLGRDLSDDGSSSVHSQDSRRSLRKSTLTQRNVAPAHLGKLRVLRDSKSTASPDSTCSSSLLSPGRNSAGALGRLEEKASPKETMLEAVGLVSRRSLDTPLSPVGSDVETSSAIVGAAGEDSVASRTRTMKLQPRISPTAMAVVPKREKKSPAQAAAAATASSSSGGPKLSIMAGVAQKKEDNAKEKGVMIIVPEVVEEVRIGTSKHARRQKRQKRVFWYMEESESSGDEGEAGQDDISLPVTEEGNDERGVAGRTRHSRQRLSQEMKLIGDGKKSQASYADAGTPTTKEGRPEKQAAGNIAPQVVADNVVTEMGSCEKKHVANEGKEIKDGRRVGNIGSRRTRSQSGHRCQESPDGTQQDDSEYHKGVKSEQDEGDSDEVDAANVLVVETVKSEIETEEGKSEGKNPEVNDDEDFLPTSLRRSQRPSNKTAKLNEYLAVLKRDKDVDSEEMESFKTLKHSIETPQDVTPLVKRGRGRPRIYAKEVIEKKEKKGRGRPRKTPAKESNGEEEIDADMVGVEEEEGRTLEMKETESVPTEEANGIPAMTSKVPKAEETDEKEQATKNSRKDTPMANHDPEIETRQNSFRSSQQSCESSPQSDGEASSAVIRHGRNDDDGKKTGKVESVRKETDRCISILPMKELVRPCQQGGKPATSQDACVETRAKEDQGGTSKGVGGAVAKEEVIDLTADSGDKPGSQPPPSSSSPPSLISPTDLQNVFPPQFTDAMKSSGQKLKIVVRSPNVEAAQKIGELLRKTAMNITSPSTDISVTMTDLANKELNGSDATSVSQFSENDSGNNKEERGLNKEQDGSKDHTQKLDSNKDLSDATPKAQPDPENPLASRSESPESVSAAYDIQSDDFSSETSNDAYDVPSKAAKESDGSSSKNLHTSANTPVINKTSTIGTTAGITAHPAVQEDSDDDVIIGEVHGLQPPDPSMSLRPPPTRVLPTPDRSGAASNHCQPQPQFPNVPFVISPPTSVVQLLPKQGIVAGSNKGSPPQPQATAIQTVSLSSPPPAPQPFVVSEISPMQYVLHSSVPPNNAGDFQQPKQEMAPAPTVTFPNLLIQQTAAPMAPPGVLLPGPSSSSSSSQPGLLFQGNAGQPVVSLPTQSHQNAQQAATTNIFLPHGSPPAGVLIHQQPAAIANQPTQQQQQQHATAVAMQVGSLLPPGVTPQQQPSLSFLTLASPRLIAPSQLGLQSLGQQGSAAAILPSGINISSILQPQAAAINPVNQQSLLRSATTLNTNQASLLQQQQQQPTPASHQQQPLMSLLGPQAVYVSNLIQQQQLSQQQQLQPPQQTPSAQALSPQQQHQPLQINPSLTGGLPLASPVSLRQSNSSHPHLSSTNHNQNFGNAPSNVNLAPPPSPLSSPHSSHHHQGAAPQSPTLSALMANKTVMGVSPLSSPSLSGVSETGRDLVTPQTPVVPISLPSSSSSLSSLSLTSPISLPSSMSLHKLSQSTLSIMRSLQKTPLSLSSPSPASQPNLSAASKLHALAYDAKGCSSQFPQWQQQQQATRAMSQPQQSSTQQSIASTSSRKHQPPSEIHQAGSPFSSSNQQRLRSPGVMVTSPTPSSTLTSPLQASDPLAAAEAGMASKTPATAQQASKVNYMGSFELNSSNLHSLLNAQGKEHERSQSILSLVKSALSSPRGKSVPGVEVRPVVTQTPHGPKKVLRVFIDEDHLKRTTAPMPPTTSVVSEASVTKPSQSQQQTVAQTKELATASAASRYAPKQLSQPALLNQGARMPQSSVFTKIVSSEPTAQQPQQGRMSADMDSQNSSQYIQIPISHHQGALPASATTASLTSQVFSRNAVQEGSQLRRPLKLIHSSQATKRKLAAKCLGNVTGNGGGGADSRGGPEAKRPYVQQPVENEDGIFRGSYGQVVTRVLQTEAPEQNPWRQVQNKADKRNALVSLLSSTSTSQAPIKRSTPSPSSSLAIGEVVPSSSPTHATCLSSSSPSVTLPTSISTTPQGPQLASTADGRTLAPSPQMQSYFHHQTKRLAEVQDTAQTSSPHKRASFPVAQTGETLMTTSQAQASPANSGGVKAKKHVAHTKKLKKAGKQKEGGQGHGRGHLLPHTEKKSKPGPRRLKTASMEGAHPLIHHKKIGSSLPQPCLEEEVVATPLNHDPGRHHPHEGAGTRGHGVGAESRLKFEITSEDGFSCQGDTMEDAWNQVIEKVKDVRTASRMKQLSYAGISGKTMFGVDHDAVVYLIEQLYGAVHCHHNYKFHFHRYDLDLADQEVPLNASGSARSEVFLNRKPYDMFNFLKSAYRIKPGDEEREMEEEMALKSARRATSLSLPMAMRFRKLKTFAKEAVDVYRSKIHGRGLFCKRNIDAGEMVIEYAGEVIRASLTDKREKYYESKGIGCYMFRIDDDEVVDATMHGSAARFINHSCEPNCFSKVIQVDGKKHIVIFAMRPIKRGEELTYDYKFPIEEVKIPCHCGSKRCRKYLN